MAMLSDKRFIGIVHRIKQSAEGEARPTMVCIRHGGKKIIHELKTETDELDFLLGRFPIKWEKIRPDQQIVWQSEEAPDGVLPHQCKKRRVAKDEDVAEIHESLILQTPKGRQVVTHVPIEFEGLTKGDQVGMILGGSGDRLAAGLSRRGELIGATVWRVPPSVFKNKRPGDDKGQDHVLLSELIERQGGIFHLVRRRDRDGIRIKEALMLRTKAMKDRIACGQRIGSSFIGRIFLSEEGHYPDGILEVMAEEVIASDAIYLDLLSEEKRREKELKAAVQASPIWPLFEAIEGVGERLAAGLIAPIADIRRFWEEPDEDFMNASRARSEALEAEAEVDEFIRESSISGENRYEKLMAAERDLRERGENDRAQMVQQAIACHKERSRARRKAWSRGRAKLRAFCGVHVCSGGRFGDQPSNRQFPRRRKGQVFNVATIARQSLYLLGDQFNRRPDSTWGQVLLHHKKRLRAKHMEVVINGKKRYTDGHILKMAQWYTRGKFIDWLFKEWTRIELEEQRAEREDSGPRSTRRISNRP